MHGEDGARDSYTDLADAIVRLEQWIAFGASEAKRPARDLGRGAESVIVPRLPVPRTGVGRGGVGAADAAAGALISGAMTAASFGLLLVLATTFLPRPPRPSFAAPAAASTESTRTAPNVATGIVIDHHDDGGPDGRSARPAITTAPVS